MNKVRTALNNYIRSEDYIALQQHVQTPVRKQRLSFARSVCVYDTVKVKCSGKISSAIFLKWLHAIFQKHCQSRDMSKTFYKVYICVDIYIYTHMHTYIHVQIVLLHT